MLHARRVAKQILVMPLRFQFDSNVLHSVAGGRSAIDVQSLSVPNEDAADAFLKGYGFDVTEQRQREQLWYFHRRALVLLTEKLGFTIDEIPQVLRDQKQLEDIRYLLILASNQWPRSFNEIQSSYTLKVLQKWSCAILRCMHVYVHAESDLFSSFAQEIQSQILSPFQDTIFHDGSLHKTFLKSKANPNAMVELLGFEVKPFKTSTSTVIKLLARPDALAMKVFDKLGVRFITRDLFGTFQVIRFLVEENLISFPHIMPDQSSNNLYPVELFLQVCDELKKTPRTYTDEEVARIYEDKMQNEKKTDAFFRKHNEQSDEDFRFIKFITRKLIKIRGQNESEFSFFYPFEVQIMDQKAHQTIQSGPSHHQAYKERQKQAARERLFQEI